MNSRLAIFVALLLLLPLEALACRCEPLPLADYYNRAEFVAMARLVSFEDQADQRILEFELPAAPYKGATDPAQTAVQLVTAASTATCGVQPDVDAIYVVFGYADPESPGLLRVDTCSGTRVHISKELDEPEGFVDVPARFVAKQLNALMGMDVLREVSRNAPRPTDPGNAKLIGLLDLKALAHGGITPLYAEPDRESPVVAEIRSWDDVKYREVGYEVPAAIVYARVPGWYRLQTPDGVWGWADAGHAGTWFPYADLPVKRLAYLTEDWSGLAWPSAGAGIPWRYDVSGPRRQREYPVNVIDSAIIGGMPFFRVEILETDPCSGDDEKVRGAGWVPGYNQKGETGIWYYSRGC